MRLILFDDHSWDNLLPLTFTRPAADLRVGFLTIAEKWELELGEQPAYLTQGYLSAKFTCCPDEDKLLVNGSLIPDPEVVKTILSLEKETALCKLDTLLALRTGMAVFPPIDPALRSDNSETYWEDISIIDYPWKIFSTNGAEIEADMGRIALGRESAELSPTVKLIGSGKVFVEPGFKGEHFTLNTSGGSVYLGKDSEIMEGSVIRGPFALCEGSVVKMGAKIYGPTTIGPYSKVGGELKNVVIQSNSNKAHDGYLGNAVIGEWCNLGAGTSNSNLKNTYSEVNIWNYPKKDFIKTGLQYNGLIMGDHSKSGINTMFNTGTVVGVSANIFGSGFHGKFIPSFSWGGPEGLSAYRMEKVMETISRVHKSRGSSLSVEDRHILQHIYDETEEFRKWN